MAEVLNIQPSLRRAKFSLVLCVLFLALVIWCKASLFPEAAWWFVVVGVLPFIAPALAFVDAIRTRLWLDEGLLRYRHGFLVQTTRAMELRKIQDVRVERTLVQRMWGIGTLILESAGESSRLVVADIDNPQRAADAILQAGRQEGISKDHV
ncbi:MAG: PH domain-containing protein [Bryobacterales bacterium]|nr:PH domain-containing protein [Bryobacterales bacterium]